MTQTIEAQFKPKECKHVGLCMMPPNGLLNVTCMWCATEQFQSMANDMKQIAQSVHQAYHDAGVWQDCQKHICNRTFLVLRELGLLDDARVIEQAEKDGKTVETDTVKMLDAALREITEGKGAFSQDQLTHASNTIRDMKQIAQDALNRKAREV